MRGRKYSPVLGETMPELPEVEYTARQLRASVVGATISEAQVFWERTIGYPELPDFLAEVAGRRIIDVRRRGKFLVLALSGGLFLTIHRRMTGNLLLLPPGWEIDTSLKTSDPVAWNIKGPLIQTPVGADVSHPSPIMAFHKLNGTSVGADLSRTSPIYRLSDLLYC